MPAPYRTALLLALGAVLGTLCDRMHLIGGVLGYPSKQLAGQALWVPPLFAWAAFALADGHRRIAVRLGAPGSGTSPLQLAGTFLLFATAYAATAFTPLRDANEDAAMLGAQLIGWLGYVLATGGRGPGHALHVAGTVVAGVGFEMLLSSTGAFFYVRPTLVNVPIWLPGLYLWAAELGGAMDRCFAPAEAAAPATAA